MFYLTCKSGLPILTSNRSKFLSKISKKFTLYAVYPSNKRRQDQNFDRAKLDAGEVVTIPRQVTHNILTTHGVACMKGKSTWHRAEALINIAHQDFRDELAQEAEKMGMWKYSSRLS